MQHTLKHSVLLAALVSAIFVLSACAEPATPACLKYAPAKVSVTGRLFVREDFGPPNYGENPESDSKERHIYIALDRPICVDAGDKLSDFAEPERDLKTMQLVYFVASRFELEWPGKQVELTGTLFHANTGHHQTPVLMTVEQTKLLQNSK